MESGIVSKDGLQIEDVLENDGVYPSVTSGKSMRPLFKTHRDMVILTKCAELPKKYDVVLYRYGDKYILHRIIGVDNEKSLFIIRGDNTYRREYVPRANVIGILTEFNRRGKHHTTEETGYKIYSRIWHYLYPVRHFFHLLRRLAGKIKRKIFK